MSLFREILPEISLSDEILAKLETHLSGMLLLMMIGYANEHLDPEDKQNIQDLIGQKRGEEIVPILKSKLSSEEWDQMVASVIMPTVEKFVRFLKEEKTPKLDE